MRAGTGREQREGRNVGVWGHAYTCEARAEMEGQGSESHIAHTWGISGWEGASKDLADQFITTTVTVFNSSHPSNAYHVSGSILGTFQYECHLNLTRTP